MGDLISRGKLFNLLAPVQTLGEAYGIIQEMPTVDAVPVRCKDCKYGRRNPFGDGYVCNYHVVQFRVDEDEYCGRGERKDGEHDRG